MNPATIDPGVVTLVQSTFLTHINAAFATTAHYAFNLLYLFAALELTILGIAWALQREVGWDKLFFKIIKIGLIFFIIQNYPGLLDTILHSFAKLAGLVIKNEAVTQYIINPAKIWQYGYDAGINLLQHAAIATNFLGLAMIQISLGMGILLVFSLLGIQMIVQMISFYVVSFGALILLPFGALTSSSGMFDRAVKAVIQAGLRLMILMVIIGIAVTIWDGFQLTDLATTANFNINQPLGLFFTALLFLCLAFYLPKIISQAVGNLNGNLFESNAPIVTTIRESIGAPIVTSAEGMANMQAATTIPAAATGGGYAYEGTSGTAAAATMPTTTVITPISGGIDAKFTRDTLAQASNISKSISEHTVKKIREAVMQAIKEKK